MKYLVVNADDFGACSGVNEGIIEAHERGIVTSTSLMVLMPASEEAADLARERPTLSVGLHAVCADDERTPAAALVDPDTCRAALEIQLSRFRELVGRLPTHLDSHHHVHIRPELRADFQEVADRYRIPLRACSEVHYCSSFYAHWAGERHPDQVSVASLMQILAAELDDGITELGCHPSRPDPALVSSYAAERELELRTLCDFRVRRFLAEAGIELVGFREAARLLGSSV